VNVFVPATMKEEEMKDSDGSGDGGDQWLNVTVWKDCVEGSVDGGREQQMVEEAVRALQARYDAVLRLVKSTGSPSSSSPKRPSPSSPSCSPPTETDCAVVKRQKLS
jgi:hypothetical protein